jgi:hypothetical protein
MIRFHIQSEHMFPVLVAILISILIVNLETEMSHATAMNIRQLTIPAYELTTRGNLFNTQGVIQ